MRSHKTVLPIFFISVLLGFFEPCLQAVQKPEIFDKIIKIGLLIPDNNARAAKDGAELAIRKANKAAGLNGKHFQLVVRSMEGPWGTGSKQTVNLIFDENVCAIMGSHDGRNAHLVEQVTTKTRIVFLSSWASDPTLSEAFVPWCFSCVPNDLQQADALIEEIYNKRKIDRTVAISDNSYDSKMALESFMKRIKLDDKKEPLQLFYDNTGGDCSVLINKIKKSDARSIILFGSPSASAKLIQEFKIRGLNIPIFGALSLLNDNEISDQDMQSFENVIFVSPGILTGKNKMAFVEEFKNTYGKIPGVMAEYSYDGMNLLIDAIKNAGTERVEIQNYLSKVHYEGVTGLIQFDNRGKRMGIPDLIEIENGVPVTVKR